MYPSRLLLMLIISKIQINFVWSPHTSIPGSTVPGWAHLTPPLHNATNTQQGPAQLYKLSRPGKPIQFMFIIQETNALDMKSFEAFS